MAKQFPQWQISFPPPASQTGLEHYTILVNNGAGFVPVISNVAFEPETNPGYGPFTVNSTLRIDTSYNFNSYTVRSNPISINSPNQQALGVDKISTFGGNTYMGSIATTFADYRIMGFEPVDNIGSINFNVYEFTVGNAASNSTNSGGYSVSTVNSYYEFINYSRIDYHTSADLISTIDFGTMPTTNLNVVYVATGVGIISLG
jgi:hypothetical protein